MGQILLEDKIGALSHSSGVITLATSRLTLGGQQYVTSSLNRTISADVTMIANTRYFVYARVVGGVPALRISTSVPSVYIAANPSSKLVGAYQSNDSSSFGTFYLSIDGIPKMSGTLGYSGLIRDSAGTNVQSGSPIANVRQYRIEGKWGYFSGAYYHTTTPGIAGSGRYNVAIPTNMTIFEWNTSYGENFMTASNTGVGSGNVGGDIGGGQFMMGFGANPNANDRFQIMMNAATSGAAYWGQSAPNIYAMNQNFLGVAWNNIRYMIDGYSDTPLKDL